MPDPPIPVSAVWDDPMTEAIVTFDVPIAFVGPASQWRLVVQGQPEESWGIAIVDGNVVLMHTLPVSIPTAVSFLGPAGSVIGVGGGVVQPFAGFPVA